jgi:hypothetical protein
MNNIFENMIKTISSIYLVIILLVATSYSQQVNTTNNSIESTTIMDENLLYSFITISDNSGNYMRGFLLDVKVDTLVLLVNNQTRDISFNDVNSITIETKESHGTEGAVIGGLMGTYFFYAAFWQHEDEPFAYYDMEEPGGQLLVSVLVGAFLGSGIGYLIGNGIGETTETFEFSGSDENKSKEYKRFEDFLLGNAPAPKLHIYFQLSQVSTRLSEEEDNNDLSPFAYGHITSFNLVRKIQLTYSILDELEVGGAVCWFGEPRVEWNSYSSTTYSFSSAIHTFEGVGYYVLAVYNPFKSIFPKSLSLNVGLGAGTGTIDYKLSSSISEYYYYPPSDTTIAQLNKNLFSAMFYAQLDLFLYDSFSMGFIADYIYLPGVIPGVPELDIDSRNLGSFSFGLTLGLHF